MHVFIPSAALYLQKAVCLWSEYRARHTNKAVQACESVCASVTVQEQWVKGCVSMSGT